MPVIWISNTQTITGDGTNVEANGFIKSVQGFKANTVELTPDGTDFRITVPAQSDTIWLACGATDEFKITSAGGANV